MAYVISKSSSLVHTGALLYNGSKKYMGLLRRREHCRRSIRLSVLLTYAVHFIATARTCYG